MMHPDERMLAAATRAHEIADQYAMMFPYDINGIEQVRHAAFRDGLRRSELELNTYRLDGAGDVVHGVVRITGVST